ncbi:DUF5753 domain-containing protein [Amycolatopsis anabasis]|uniref:DUF5753 domain-containing protein n=1 Tax=Amycolatopsis anabasis TaxID=1840409 RepID=UPI0015D1025E|nr:DUF5753 domain-containing protein [Amycolatopsis anabasis]
MAEREPTIRSRELGEGIRAVIARAGLTGRDITRCLGWPQGRLSMLLAGKRPARSEDVASILAICGLTKGEERERLLELCEDRRTPGWLQQYGDRLPKQVRTLVRHEDQAASITEFQAIIVPGLLQTESYVRALMAGGANLPPGEIDDRVAARLARQEELFNRPHPPRLTFLIHESVLRLAVGGAQVMSEQLHHLLRMSVRPNISIRVIPAARGAHAGTAGSFNLLEFADLGPLVYLDSETSCLFLEEDREVTAYQRILKALAAISLDEEQSRKLIAALAVALYSSKEEPDDRELPGLAQEQPQPERRQLRRDG